MRGDDTDVYLLWHPDWQALKVGMCGRGNSRIKSHEKHGWSLVGRLEFGSRRTAKHFEQSVLNLWRSKEWKPLPATSAAISRWNDSAGGITETVSAALTDGWREVWSLMIAMGPHARVVFGAVRCPQCGGADTVLHAHDLPAASWVPQGFTLVPTSLERSQALIFGAAAPVYAFWAVISIISFVSTGLWLIRPPDHPTDHGPGAYAFMGLLCANMIVAIGLSTRRLWQVARSLLRSRAAMACRDQVLQGWASSWACHRCRQAFDLDGSQMVEVDELRAAIWRASGFIERESGTMMSSWRQLLAG